MGEEMCDIYTAKCEYEQCQFEVSMHVGCSSGVEEEQIHIFCKHHYPKDTPAILFTTPVSIKNGGFKPFYMIVDGMTVEDLIDNTVCPNFFPYECSIVNGNK